MLQSITLDAIVGACACWLAGVLMTRPFHRAAAFGAATFLGAWALTHSVPIALLVGLLCVYGVYYSPEPAQPFRKRRLTMARRWKQLADEIMEHSGYARNASTSHMPYVTRTMTPEQKDAEWFANQRASSEASRVSNAVAIRKFSTRIAQARDEMIAEGIQLTPLERGSAAITHPLVMEDWAIKLSVESGKILIDLGEAP